MSLFASSRDDVDTDFIEDTFLTAFGATVIAWMSKNTIHIDILGNTPQLDDFICRGLELKLGGTTFMFIKNHL